MTTYAQVYGGIARNPVPKDPAECFAPEWLAKESAAGRTFSVVPGGTVHTAKDNGNGTFTNPSTAPQPNTPGNPYFGKTPMPTSQFWIFVQKVLGGDRMKRLIGDKNFIGFERGIQATSVIDPDDKAGQFLQVVADLVATNGEDGKPLVENAERDAIMAAWL